jgi:hypothetical protein
VERPEVPRLSATEWLALTWGALTFVVAVLVGGLVAPWLATSFGELAAMPRFSRVVLHPAFLVAAGGAPLALSATAIRQGWAPARRLTVILAGAGWSLALAGLVVVAMYLPLFSLAGRVGQ